MSLYLCFISWEAIHAIVGVKSDYKTCRWLFHLVVWCIFVLVCAYQYMYIFDNIHTLTYANTHIRPALSLYAFRFFPHTPSQVRIVFFLFHLFYGMRLAKVFGPRKVSDVFPRWFPTAVAPPLRPHSPPDTPGTIPGSCGVILASDTKLSPLGPANTSSCLCYFSLTLVMTSPGCQLASILAFQSF